jgi:hypothetical protein
MEACIFFFFVFNQKLWNVLHAAEWFGLIKNTTCYFIEHLNKYKINKPVIFKLVKHHVDICVTA